MKKEGTLKLENTHKYPISPEIHWSAQIFVVYTIRFVEARNIDVLYTCWYAHELFYNKNNINPAVDSLDSRGFFRNLMG